MQKIVGFFANHGHHSVHNIPLIITEIEKTFAEDYSYKIVIKESARFDPVRAQEIFQRSSIETNLLKLFLESEYKSEKEREVFRTVYAPKATASYLRNERSYFLFLLNELSKLRTKIQFQLLCESGTTQRIESLYDQLQEIIRQEEIAIIQGKPERAEFLSIQGEVILYEQSRLRDALMQNTVNGLLEQHPNLCLQIIFGKHHLMLLDSYLGQKNLKVSTMVYDGPGDFISDSIFDKIKNGQRNFSAKERQLSVIYDCITIMNEISKKNISNPLLYDLILHKGKLLEAALSELSEEYYYKLAGEKGNIFLKTLAFLENTGAFDKLQKEYPASVNFYRNLHQESKVSLVNIMSFPQKSSNEKVGRNDPCPCGSGKKYKKCCGR